MHVSRINVAVSLSVAVALLLPATTFGQASSQPSVQEGFAELTVRLVRNSDRSSIIAGTYEDARICSGFKHLGIEGDKTPTYVMTIPARVFAAHIFSAKAEGGVFSPGGGKGTTCGGIYTFTPEAGGRYLLTFVDDPSTCSATLQEEKESGSPRVAVPLAARKYTRPFFGNRFCEEEYVPSAK